MFGSFYFVKCVYVNKTHFYNFRRYKAAFAGEDSNSPHNLTARSARSDVYFPEGGKDKEERTGSYEINPGPIYENPAPESPASGDYDYPDPFPGGTRQTAVYDNPGLQRESGPVKVSTLNYGCKINQGKKKRILVWLNLVPRASAFRSAVTERPT